MSALDRLSKIILKDRISDDTELGFAIADLEFVEGSIRQASRRASDGDSTADKNIAQLETCASHMKTLISGYRGQSIEEPKNDTIQKVDFPLEIKGSSSKVGLTLNQINRECGRIRAKLSIKEHVTWERVIEDLLVKLKLSSIDELGLRRLRDIEVINNLIEVHRLINVYLSAYRAIRSFGTLHDLENELANFLKVENFECLYIGRLEKHPQVI